MKMQVMFPYIYIYILEGSEGGPRAESEEEVKKSGM